MKTNWRRLMPALVGLALLAAAAPAFAEESTRYDEK